MTIPSAQDIESALAEVRAMTPEQRADVFREFYTGSEAAFLTVSIKRDRESILLGWQLYRVMSIARGGKDLQA